MPLWEGVAHATSRNGLKQMDAQNQRLTRLNSHSYSLQRLTDSPRGYTKTYSSQNIGEDTRNSIGLTLFYPLLSLSFSLLLLSSCHTTPLVVTPTDGYKPVTT